MPTEHDINRADRLLRKMHPVFSHDLPNQVVALQSLLQMLERDGERLNAHEQETFHRLHRVAGKTSTMVRFLRELGRLNTYQRRVEEVRLAALVQEIKSELHEHVPDMPPTCQLVGAVKTVVADPCLLRQALVELLRCLLERRNAGPCALRLDCSTVGQETELRGELVWSPDPTSATTANAERDRTPLGQRLEVVLAHELLAAWGGRLSQIQEAADRSFFSVVVPHPSAHG